MVFSKNNWFSTEPLLQKDSISMPLKNRIWNFIIINISNENSVIEKDVFGKLCIRQRFINAFADNFGLRVDHIPTTFVDYKNYLRQNIFQGDWFIIYDFIEFYYFIVAWLNSDSHRNRINFIKKINKILKDENSAYQLIESWDIIPITNDEELSSVSDACKVPYENVRKHLQKAVDHFKSNNPDYRNSIKESISAVEAICRELTWEKKATLWKALKKLENNGIYINKSLELGFEKYIDMQAMMDE